MPLLSTRAVCPTAAAAVLAAWTLLLLGHAVLLPGVSAAAIVGAVDHVAVIDAAPAAAVAAAVVVVVTTTVVVNETSTTTSTATDKATSTPTTTTYTLPTRSCDLLYCDNGTSYCVYWGGYSSYDYSHHHPVPGETHTVIGTCQRYTTSSYSYSVITGSPAMDAQATG